jgi:hypothetical protein
LQVEGQLAQFYFDPQTGLYNNPQTGQSMTPQQAQATVQPTQAAQVAPQQYGTSQQIAAANNIYNISRIKDM